MTSTFYSEILSQAYALHENNQWAEAIVLYKQAISHRDFPVAYLTDVENALCHALDQLGSQAQSAGLYQQAETYYQEILHFKPNNAVYYYNLGNAQRDLGKTKHAVLSYQKSIQLDQEDADAHNNLGNTLRELGRLDEAIDCYKKALELNPKLYHAKVHLVHQQQHICDWGSLEADVTEIRQWVSQVPQAQISPFAFLAMPSTTAEEHKQCAKNWIENRLTHLHAFKTHLNFKHQIKAKNKLKIGFVSADFRLHPLAFLISELIELFDRNKFEIIAYSCGVNDQTPVRKRLEQAFDLFHDVREIPEIDIAKKIYADGIDILIDLTGFTQNTRTGLFALRPAPIQVNWLGFPGTMGADFFDYILSDSTITPSTSAPLYTEALALLPHCYQPNDRLRPVAKTTNRAENNLPQDVFVLCCFNQSFKITPDIFSIWMRLLQTNPNSVLWLLECNQWAKRNLINAAMQKGISANRLIFAPRTSIEQHLARHACADLFLDTLPYNAHTTASDALWMELPLLTCAGETFASRVAASLLNAANLPELITSNLAEYEAKAQSLINEPQQLKLIKNKLKNKVKTSALFDTPKFSCDLAQVLQDMWHNLNSKSHL